MFAYSVKRTREIRKFHVAVVQRWLKMCKKRYARAKLLLDYYKLIAFLPLSLPSLSLLPKLPFVVIQKFLYHSNEILRRHDECGIESGVVAGKA